MPGDDDDRIPVVFNGDKGGAVDDDAAGLVDVVVPLMVLVPPIVLVPLNPSSSNLSSSSLRPTSSLSNPSRPSLSNLFPPPTLGSEEETERSEEWARVRGGA